jgi:hypothetical protein
MEYELNPGCTRIPQQKNFCLPTCLQIAMARGGTIVGQEILAYTIGVKISKKDKRLYTLDFEVREDRDPEVGFRFPNFKQERAKEFLRRMGYEVDAFKISEIRNLEEFIIKNIGQNNDQILNIHLWGIDQRRTNDGHYMLVDRYDDGTKKLTVCDPSPRYKALREIPLATIEEAMSSRYDGQERGIAVLKKIKKSFLERRIDFPTKRVTLVDIQPDKEVHT